MDFDFAELLAELTPSDAVRAPDEQGATGAFVPSAYVQRV